MDPTNNLRKTFTALYTRLRNQVQHKWKRDLPLNEMLFDRWERAANLNFGKDASIYHQSYVYGDVQVGDKTWIGPMTVLDGTGGLKIGKNCSISSGVQIYTHDTVKWAVSGGKSKYRYAPTSIGDCCFIGPNVVIQKGVRVGNHCVIATGAVVTSNIADFSIAAGIPAKPIGKVVFNSEGNVELTYPDRKA